MLRLDEDLARFYDAAADDPELAWVTRGAGRMLRSPTVFEDVVKTICTTNCAWSATVRMVTRARRAPRRAGARRADGPSAAPSRRPRRWPKASDFYRDVVARRLPRRRTSARWPTSSPSGELDLEGLGNDPTSSPTTRSRRGCSRCPASARTRRRTS